MTISINANGTLFHQDFHHFQGKFHADMGYFYSYLKINKIKDTTPYA